MTRARVSVLLGFVFLLVILGGGAGAWWYLYGPNKVDAAELVPADTMFFATIPNAATIVTGYQTSQLKQLVDSPNSQPVSDAVVKAIGQKNLDLLNSFLPNLSGQSFFAITHFDADKPAQIGIIAGMRPKAGMASFDAFIEKLKATWPEALKQGSTGTATVDGVDFQWLQGPGGSDKICVAQVNGWIITTWGTATLQDWIERFQKKSSTPSLAQNADYKKTIARVGKDPMSLVYINYHPVFDLLQKQMTKTNPHGAEALLKRFAALSGAAVGTNFENGEIVDRFSSLMPRPAQLEAGLGADPCPFETLKFTGAATRLYWASNVNWPQYVKNLQEQGNDSPMANPMASAFNRSLQTFAQSAGIDLQHNVIDALGSEFSVQAEWNDDTTYPEVGIFVKVAKPDDFKSTITALIETVRKAYINSAVVTELNSNGQTFSALNFIQPSPIVPTITETGPYFAIFSSENLAVRSFSRDDLNTLPHNPDFLRQIGDKRNGASQIGFVDTPHLADRAYHVAMPYLSIASMFNKDLAAWVQGKNLPPDLTWLAPMGTWSFVLTPDAEGLQGYSVSGIGNQGILMAITGVGGFTVAQRMGMIPNASKFIPAPAPANPSVAPTPATTSPAINPSGATNSSASPAPPPSVPLPDAMTNIPSATTPTPATNAAPTAPDATAPTASPTNAAPSAPDIVPPASSTNSNSTPATNSASDATKTP